MAKTLSRRFVLKSLAAGVAAASHSVSFSRAPRSVPLSKADNAFIVHNDLPWALETRRSQFRFGPITSASHLFVRNNLPMPPPTQTGLGDDWFSASSVASVRGYWPLLT